MRRVRFAILCLLCFETCLLSYTQTSSPKVITVKAAHLLDVKTGDTIQKRLTRPAPGSADESYPRGVTKRLERHLVAVEGRVIPFRSSWAPASKEIQ